MIRPPCDNDFAYQLRQIAGATLAATISLGFAYTSMNLFVSNQRNYIRNFKKFQNAKHTCRAVHQPLPTNENKLVHCSGDIRPSDAISDDTFQITPKPEDQELIYLYRECEMYQWMESKSNTYNTYSKTWSSAYMDSSHFEEMEGHQNPSNMIHSKLFHTKHFTVSSFTFNLEQNQSITEPKTSIQLLLKRAKLLKQYAISLDGKTSMLRHDHSKDGWYYFANNDGDDDKDNIGDIRVRFWIITKAFPLTVIGRQNEQKISLGNDNISMRCIGAYKLDDALKKYFHVKLINRETGSIFVMTHIALSCFIYAAQAFKSVWLEPGQISDAKTMDCNGQNRSVKANELGLRALLGTVSICGPMYCLSSLYPHMEILYGNHPVFMNSVCVLAAASVVVGTQHFTGN